MKDPFDVLEFARSIARDAPGVKEIWLLGSRANGTAREDSDWDLLILGTDETLTTLRRTPSFHRDDVDALVAANNEFVNAWGEKVKSGSMAGWEWVRLNDFFAEYLENKWEGAGDGARVRSRRRKAIQLWPNDGMSA